MPTVSEILRDHVTLSLESFDRLYLNGYVPTLQTPGQLVHFLSKHRGQPIPSPALLDRITKGFREAVATFAQGEGIPTELFPRGERKEDFALPYRQRYAKTEGVYLIGTAQERAHAFKGRRVEHGGHVSFDYTRAPVYVSHVYFYLVDRDFGPAFVKIGTYAPYPIKVCLNGHEWLKHQLAHARIPFEAWDNMITSCADPERLQRLADQLGLREIEAFFRKWIERLPFPLTPEDRRAGYQHELSIWQAEMSLTQVFDRPARGREFFEDVIRENLDLGRPDRVQLLFNRRVTKATPGSFATRVVCRGVSPSLRIEYKTNHVVQYFKGDPAGSQGLRTETAIREARDFGVGRSLDNLPYLGRIARNLNRRLLEVERVSEHCRLSEEAVNRITGPTVHDGQRAPGLKFGDPRVIALLAALCLFLHLPDGFRNAELRQHVAALLGPDAKPYGPRQMTYDLRRLRLKGILARHKDSRRHFLTPYGWKVCHFFTRLHARVFRPALGTLAPDQGPAPPHPLRQALARVDREINRILERSRLVPAA